MIKAKKYLILLVILFIVLITIFTTIRFRTVKNFTKVYTYTEWKMNSNNGLRIAFLEFLNRKSFLPFELDLIIIDSKGKKISLDKGKKHPKLYNREFYIENLSLGDAFILGNIKYDSNVVDKFKIPIKIIEKFSKNNVKLAPIILTESSSDFKEDDKVTIYPRFNELSENTNDEKDIMIQLFGYPIDFAFSEKNKVFLLITKPDYTPINLRAELNIKEFFAKKKNLTLNTDENGIISFDENIYRADGFIYLNSKITKKKKIPFELSPIKTAILTDKYLYKQNELIKLKIKTYKKIDKLFFNIVIGNSWVKNQEIKINANKAEIEFYPPKDFEGFIEFNVYKGYSYLKDYSYRKIYIGDKNKLKAELLKINNGFINKVINKNTDNEVFYNLIISQLEHNNIGISKVFDSYKLQQEKLDNDREKYQSIIWILLLLVATSIILIIFFTSYFEIKKSQKDIEIQFRKKGGVIYLYFFITILSIFMILILWVLKIV